MIEIKKFKLRDMVKTVSPILLTPQTDSITIGLSKRFFLFNAINKAIKTIEDDPHLNFISVLKSYKILGRILYGTVYEFYRDRNKLYFKNFFLERSLWKLIKEDLEWLYKNHKDVGEIKMTITKRGVIVYDNYKKDSFNLLLMTIHSGTWVPERIQRKMTHNNRKRYREEDVETHRIYCGLVIQKGGIWIDSKQSRFACDFNRSMRRAIYKDDSEEWIGKYWKEELTNWEINVLQESYREFYFTLTKLVDTYKFNIIFDSHSMKDGPGRANISFGTKYIPQFYMPIVLSFQKKLRKLGYKEVCLNKPFGGGYILQWLSTKYPHTFIFSMEVNKKLYMTDDYKKPYINKIKRLSRDITQIFDIEVEIDETNQ